uniref:NADH dehydrogenase subunit 3 n=1 Tax=Musculium lacustre TaxID=98299 RepID=UPI002238CAB2|nr:NADH dehydrogenase subunit 3 [Musculium lacustre]UYR45710.1 NADH dehydrogenase subunit 3 [Musculium lacustre]UYR45723.1 NADH dehydrogenase subunit 3 [Musculium lacustre]
MFFSWSEIGAFDFVTIGGLYMIVIFMIVVFMIFGAFWISQSWRMEWAKFTSFECGFDSMSSSRTPFSLRFFLLGIMFVVFDVEVVLLVPYILSIGLKIMGLAITSKFLCFIFLLILFFGLAHECNEGSLEWNQ